MTRAHKNAGRGFKGLLCVLLLMHLQAFRSECAQNKEGVEHFPSFSQVVNLLPSILHTPLSSVMFFYSGNEKKSSNFMVL